MQMLLPIDSASCVTASIYRRCWRQKMNKVQFNVQSDCTVRISAFSAATAAAVVAVAGFCIDAQIDD
ncbi:hypothetical protein T4D_15029 [Trichinella pseudospiralis]|uniref:Uncharacterized protein n=1 Tax=Trichinella pseudospiralis TaxID=6337 RepID=A0A0V1F697_TRIPS|nr:hypothetical protein T4D_15029 [Trichinella pseudospiralis]